MRVATRRARAFLRAARPLVDQEWGDELRSELGWLGSALGPARDLDVLVEHMREQVSLLGDEGTAMRGLVDGLERRRRKARASAVAALSEDRYLGLVDRLEDPQPPPAAPGASPTLAELWWAEFVRTRRRFERLDRKSSDDELHAARIRVKRTRYAAELAASELGVAGERFVEAAKLLQDVLGAHQDAFVAEQHIRAWSQGKTEAADCRPHTSQARARAPKERACRVAAGLEAARASRTQGASVIRAAGGVVTRRGETGLEVLVVHRPKYRDWSLPKGKALRGERDEACAAPRGRRGDRFALRARRGASHHPLPRHPWTREARALLVHDADRGRACVSKRGRRWSLAVPRGRTPTPQLRTRRGGARLTPGRRGPPPDVTPLA